MCGPIERSGGVSTHTKYITKYLEESGATVILYNQSPERALPLPFTVFVKLSRRTYLLLFQGIKRKKYYDILHTQVSGGIFSFISTMTGCLISKICNKKLIITFHYRPSKRFINNYKLLFWFVLKYSDGFFVVSKKQKSLIKETFHDLSKEILVIPNGFDKNIFRQMNKNSCRNSLNLPNNKKILISVGNLVEIKGYNYLIDAIEQIVRFRKDIICLIIGSGPFKEKIEKQIEKAYLEEYVKIIGQIDHNEIPVWINACDIFVLPSLNEGNPTVMFECLGCGKPFIGTKVGGIPEIITSEDYGFLVEPGDPKDLERKILIAFDKKWDYEKIENYSQQFTWEKIANEILKIYEKI